MNPDTSHFPAFRSGPGSFNCLQPKSNFLAVPMQHLILLVAGMFLNVTAMAATGEVRNPVITESVTAKGLSRLHIASADGRDIATYDVDLRNHHKPVSEASENIRRWESWKFGAFVHFNLNTFAGDEFTQGPATLYRPSKLNVPS